MPDRFGRTPEQREAARVEREQRRAQRMGPSPPPPPVPEPSPPPAREPSPAREPAPPPVSAPSPPVAYEPAATDDHEPPVYESVPPEPMPVEPEVAGVSARPVRTFPSPPDPEFYVPDDDLEEPEVASGTRRVSRLGNPRPGRGRPVARKRPPVDRKRTPADRRTSWRGRIASLIALVLAGGVVWFGIELFQPFGTSPHGEVTVQIAPHATADQIGHQLAADKVIASSFFFTVRATLAGDRGDMRAGTYHLQQGMSYHAVLATLTHVPKAAPTSQLTITEGHTRQYVAALLRAQHIGGNYLAETRASPLLDPRQYGAPRSVRTLEGFLFPDTFTLVEPIRTSALVADQLRDFKRRFATVGLGYAHRIHLSDYQVLIVASLIEAEAASERARPLIASVIYNRLHDHMMLQFDSTARYATGNFTRPLTVSQLESPSPYNTHTHFGLPPTPIDSPGLASLQAAAHPARSPYLYFFAKPCTDQTVFANNYAQFQGLLQRDRRPHCS